MRMHRHAPIGPPCGPCVLLLTSFLEKRFEPTPNGGGSATCTCPCSFAFLRMQLDVQAVILEHASLMCSILLF